MRVVVGYGNAWCSFESDAGVAGGVSADRVGALAAGLAKVECGAGGLRDGGSVGAGFWKVDRLCDIGASDGVRGLPVESCVAGGGDSSGVAEVPGGEDSGSSSDGVSLGSPAREVKVDGSCGFGGVGEVCRGPNYRRNKVKRENKKKKEAASSVLGVPEWRQKSPGALVHKGAFSGCSQETQLALTETRARRMIAENKAAEVKAEESARKTAAMLKSRMVEEQVERERLELEKKMKSLRDTAAPPQGYCETVLSALATPSLSDGTVSPDSSISMAEVHKKDEAIKMLVGRCEEQRREGEKTRLAMQELEAKFEKFRLVTRESTLERARRDREREVEQRGQRGESRWNGVKAAFDSGAREYSGDETTKVAWVTSAEA